MSAFSAIDLPQLPIGDVVESVDPNTIRAEIEGLVRALHPALPDPVPNSDPIAHVLDALTQRETHWRSRVNSAALAVLLASAMGSDLDQIAALFGVLRKPGELDEPFRRRIQLSVEAYTVAGSVGAYKYHAISVDGVRDADIDTPQFRAVKWPGLPNDMIALQVDYSANLPDPRPGDVAVTVLPENNLTQEQTTGLATAVSAVLDRRTIVPVNDRPRVSLAEPVPFHVRATLEIQDGPSAGLVLAAAEKALRAELDQTDGLGREVTRSALIAALKVEGVHDLALHEPAQNVTVTRHQVAVPEQINLQRGAV